MSDEIKYNVTEDGKIDIVFEEEKDWIALYGDIAKEHPKYENWLKVQKIKNEGDDDFPPKYSAQELWDWNSVNEFIKEETAEGEFTCCICGKVRHGDGNNPAPVKKEGRCCAICNETVVKPARLRAMGIKI